MVVSPAPSRNSKRRIKRGPHWADILGDEVMAAALIDRLMHHCHVVNIRGNSYRMREHTDLWHAIQPKADKRAQPIITANQKKGAQNALRIVTSLKVCNFRAPHMSSFRAPLTAATDKPDLPPPRHIPTLPISAPFAVCRAIKSTGALRQEPGDSRWKQCPILSGAISGNQDLKCPYLAEILDADDGFFLTRSAA
jgi:IstB-like ATP binding protein